MGYQDSDYQTKVIRHNREYYRAIVDDKISFDYRAGEEKNVTARHGTVRGDSGPEAARHESTVRERISYNPADAIPCNCIDFPTCACLKIYGPFYGAYHAPRDSVRNTAGSELPLGPG